jgi:two-component system, OmpR family, response regulator VicR
MQDRASESSGLASQYPEVLVVSGDLSLSQFLSEGLTESGFWMSVVRSGLQALEVFRLRSFGALIIDAAVSDLPMDELIRRLRRNDDGVSGATRQSATTPIVVIAGIPGELEPFDLQALDLKAVFVAPFELDDLASTLKAVAKGATQA